VYDENTQKSSGTRREKDQNIQFIADVIEFVKELIQSRGKDIWPVGDADISQYF
jgi:hypothetical protein